MNIQNEKNLNHEVFVKARREMKICGVEEVISFDEKEIHIITCCGELYIDGSEMHIDTLDIDKSIVAITGKIDSFFYSNESEKERSSFWGKLFK